MYQDDKRIVMTLDAGGTKFSFSAIQGFQEVIEPFVLPSNAENLERCLDTLEEGFLRVKQTLLQKGMNPSAISFAFPGPADFQRGIILDLNNMKAFRGGVALGAFLEHTFQLPVFINNDADLFTYGECIAGVLPEINRKLAEAGSSKQYHNLIGFTFGTGFGCGITSHQELYVGDNSSAGEITMMRHKTLRNVIIEEGVSIRAIQRVYHEHSNDERKLQPLDILYIAQGALEGDREAALASFEEFGEIAGDGIANAMTLLDGLVVIGGGLAGNKEYFLPAMMRELNGSIETLSNEKKSRLEMKAYLLDDPADFDRFAQDNLTKIRVPKTDLYIDYDPIKKMGIVFSKLGTSKATSIGAYAYALHELDKTTNI